MKKIILIALLLLFLKPAIIAQNNIRDTLKQMLSRTKEDTTKIDLLNAIGFTYAFVYEDTAIIYANRGLELSRKIGYKTGEAKCLQLLSLSLTLLGNFTSGLQYGFDFLSVSEKLKDTSMIVAAYDELGICYREQEDYTEALKYEYKAVALSNMANLSNDEKGTVFGTISSIHERNNRLDSALYYGRRAYELIKNWSGLYLKLGNTYAKLGQKDTALYYYRQGIPLAEQYLIYIDLIDIYNKMSGLFESAGNKDSAIYYANKSIQQEGILSYPEGRLRAVTQLAGIYASRGLKDSTIKYLKLSVTLREKMFNREKTREAQGLAFNEKIYQQELATRQVKEQNRIKMYALLAIITAFLIIAFIQWRNNKHKQKTNTLLQEQKEKVESTLTELKSTQSQLIQSEKMASLGELTAGIAHEIQNPLNFVNNFSEVSTELVDEMNTEIEKGNTADAKLIAQDLKQNLEKINHHGKRAGDIVKGMLQHSRSGVKEPTDINKLADEYLRLAYHGLRAKDKSFNATMKTDFDESIGNINIIPQDIGRVILNLITNAFYAATLPPPENIGTGSGGVSEPNYKHEPAVWLSTKKAGNKVLISVKDNGPGIPAKIADKIFQPFFTTKPAGQGTGLGLSLAYDIIKAHGGELKVETKEGTGSEFIITLPIT